MGAVSTELPGVAEAKKHCGMGVASMECLGAVEQGGGAG